MIARALLLCVLAAPLSAADGANRPIEIALANALNAGDAKAAIALFDPKMAGYATVADNLEKLAHDSELALAINTDTGVWTLRITARDVAEGMTHREAKVAMTSADGRIVSFTPANFFEPPQGRGAWNALFQFASALNDETAPPSMGQFDPEMPHYQEIKTGVATLWGRYQIDSSLDLLSHEGDDTHRTLRVDWTLTLMNPQDNVDSTRREQTVVCKMEKQGRAWRVVGLEPVGLFAP